MTNWCVTTACCVYRCVCVYQPAGTWWSSDIFVILFVKVKKHQVVEQSWRWRLFPWSFIFNTQRHALQGSSVRTREEGDFLIISYCAVSLSASSYETFMPDWVTVCAWHRWFPHAFVLRLHVETPDESVVLLNSRSLVSVTRWCAPPQCRLSP